MDKEKKRENNRRYYQKHIEKIKEYNQQYRQEHKEEIKERNKQYRRKHREELKKRDKEYHRIHKKEAKQYAKRYGQDHKEELKQYRQDHKEEAREYMKKYRQENKEKIKEQCSQYYKNHEEQVKEREKQYRQNHREKINEHARQYRQENREKRNEYQRVRWRIDIGYKLNRRMSSMIHKSLRNGCGKRGYHWEDLVGYTSKQLKRHLKRTIPDGYSWQDYLSGKLQIDHRTPVSVFNITSPEDIDFQRCWALENLQLLPAEENHKKRAKLLKPFQKCFPIKIRIV